MVVIYRGLFGFCISKPESILELQTDQQQIEILKNLVQKIQSAHTIESAEERNQFISSLPNWNGTETEIGLLKTISSCHLLLIRSYENAFYLMDTSSQGTYICPQKHQQKLEAGTDYKLYVGFGTLQEKSYLLKVISIQKQQNSDEIILTYSFYGPIPYQSQILFQAIDERINISLKDEGEGQFYFEYFCTGKDQFTLLQKEIPMIKFQLKPNRLIVRISCENLKSSQMIFNIENGQYYVAKLSWLAFELRKQ